MLVGEHQLGKMRTRGRARSAGTVGALLLILAGTACAAEDLEVVTGPDTNQTTTTTGSVFTSDVEGEGGEDVGGTTNAIAEETTSSSSSTSSSSTTSPPDTTDEDTTSTSTPPSTDGGGGGGNGGGGSSTTSALRVDNAAANQSVAFVNQKRSQNYVPPLRADTELTELAVEWAKQMARDQDMRHNPNLGDQMPDGYRAWGENVAYGFVPADINEAWWDSDGHRANILSYNYSAIGVGFVQDASGDYWAVQVFAG